MKPIDDKENTAMKNFGINDFDYDDDYHSVRVLCGRDYDEDDEELMNNKYEN